MLVNYFSLWAGLLVIINIYRIFNLLRVMQDRVHSDYLYFAARRTSLVLIAAQAVTYLSARLLNLNWHTGVYILLGLQAAAAIAMVVTTSKGIRNTKTPALTQNFPTKDLPTVTIAIPARNETTDLEECLESLVNSDYPKLEIQVLDDCSQNQRTPEIIRQFAQRGVRFIAGQVPPDKWLAKNYAYQQLAAAANGEILMFCGVDTRFAADTVSQLVKTMLQQQSDMLCAIPRNELKGGSKLKQVLLQPSRYAWEFCLPRRLTKRPPVLSTCWLINRKALKDAGGFSAVSRKIVPESYFAHQLHAHYAFMESDSLISRKAFDEQLKTAVRTRYPQLHKRPEMVLLVSMLEFSILLWPFVVLIAALLSRQWLPAFISLATCLLFVLQYSLMVALTYRRFIVHSLWFLPVAALYDIGLLNYSMWKYEFDTVDWKGRNVCIPVMRVIPELPKT